MPIRFASMVYAVTVTVIALATISGCGSSGSKHSLLISQLPTHPDICAATKNALPVEMGRIYGAGVNSTGTAPYDLHTDGDEVGLLECYWDMNQGFARTDYFVPVSVSVVVTSRSATSSPWPDKDVTYPYTFLRGIGAGTYIYPAIKGAYFVENMRSPDVVAAETMWRNVLIKVSLGDQGELGALRKSVNDVGSPSYPNGPLRAKVLTVTRAIVADIQKNGSTTASVDGT